MSKLVPASLAIAALGLAAWAFWPGATPEPSARTKGGKGPIPVLIAEVSPQEFLDSLEALGTAQANESVEITAKISERVDKIHFSDGQTVQAGQVLVELASEESSAAEQESQVRLAEQRRQLARLTGTPTATARTIIEQQHSNVQTAEAQLAAARARQQQHQISAPFAGTLGLRAVSVGNLVAPGALITTLDDLSQIKVDFSVPETFLAGLAAGQMISVRTDAVPDTEFSGKVLAVATRVDPLTRTVAVRALIPNPDGRLKPGLLLSVRLIKNRRTALAIPESALVPLRDQQFVYVIENDRARRVEVRIGSRRASDVEVLDGLKAGQQVVREGTIRLTDGSAVQVVKSANGATTTEKR